MRYILAFVVLMLSATVQAATFCVATNGSDGASGNYPGSCKFTLDSALGEVSPGDTIYLMAGEHPGGGTSVSGTSANRITITVAPGVAKADACLYTTADDSNSRSAVISASSNHTDYTIKSIRICPTVQDSGKYGIYHNGGNHRWLLDDVTIISASRTGAQLYSDRLTTGRDGSSNKVRGFRANGDDIVVKDSVIQYWPDQVFGVSDNSSRITALNSVLEWSGSHNVGIGGDCFNRSMDYVDHVFYRIQAGQSWSSDGIQIDAEDKNNPNDLYHSLFGQFPCKSGVRIVQGVFWANGENSVDFKGVYNYVVEGSLQIAMNADGTSGPGGSPGGSGCQGMTTGGRGMYQLVRGNAFVDGAAWVLHSNSGTAIYGNTGVNTERWHLSGDRDDCNSGADVAGIWGGPMVFANNLDVGGTLFFDTESAFEPASQAIMDGNVWESQGRLSGDKWKTSSSGYRSHSAFRDALPISFAAREQNSLELPTNSIMVDQNLGGANNNARWNLGWTSIADPLSHITWNDVSTNADRFRVQDTFLTGSVPVAYLQSATSNSTVLDLGNQAAAVCCIETNGVSRSVLEAMGLDVETVDLIMSLREGDYIDVGGTVVQVTGRSIPGGASGSMKYVHSIVNIDTAITAPADTPIRVMRAGWMPTDADLRTVRGAYYYWDGTTDLLEDGGAQPPPDPTDSVRIATSSDDAEEDRASGVVTLTSSYLDMPVNTGNGQDQYIALRFPNVQIVQGALIASAVVEFIANAPKSGAVSMSIDMENTGNAAVITAAAGDISNRTYTNSVTWATPNWTLADAAYNTIDLSALVQQIVNHGDWASGNAMLVRVYGSLGESVNRVAKSYDQSSTEAPILKFAFNVDNESPVLAPIGEQTIEEQSLLTVNVSATDDSGPPVLTADFSALPVGNNAVLVDAGDGTGIITWRPNDTIGSPFNITVRATDAVTPVLYDEQSFSTIVTPIQGGTPDLPKYQVQASADDAHEACLIGDILPCPVIIDATSLPLSQGAGLRESMVGLRFTDVVVPQGARTAQSFIICTVDDTFDTPTSVTVYGEKAPFAAQFTTGVGDISTRNLTIASVVWNLNANSGLYKSPDLWPVLDELFADGNWDQGDPLVLVLKRSAGDYRLCESYDSDPANAPTVTIQYGSASSTDIGASGSGGTVEEDEQGGVTEGGAIGIGQRPQ